MKTVISIFVSFVILQNILKIDVLCLSSEFVECFRNRYGDLEAKLTLQCSIDSQQIDSLSQNHYSLSCTSLQFNGYSVDKSRIKQVNIKNCNMSKLTINYDIFAQYSRLEELNIAYIGLERLEKETFERAVYMKKFNASHNNIQEFPSLLFLTAEKMNEADISYNRIKRIEPYVLTGAKQLKALNMSHNEISNISEIVFESSLGLEYINLSHNKISVIEPKTFSTLKQLKTLDVSHNKVKNISEHLFENALQLQFLNLSYNEITVVEPKAFVALKNLTKLDLSFNSIKILYNGFFDGLDKLQWLSLVQLSNDSIEIEASAFIGLDRLTQLYLGHNHIGPLKMGVFEGLHNLQELYIGDSAIDELAKSAFFGLSLLTILDLSSPFNSHNYRNPSNVSRYMVVDKTAFEDLISLEKLNLANIPIGSLSIGTFSKLKNLRFLNLSNTNLTEIQLGTFSHTRNLQTLDLSFNQLKSIDFSLFSPRYPQLELLYLNKNRLTDLEGLTHTLFPSLHFLAIAGNNFNCSYLKQFLNDKTWLELTFENDHYASQDPHVTNIHGVKCDPVDGNREKATVVTFDASTITTTTIKATTTAIKYDVHESAESNHDKSNQEKCINFDTKLFATGLTEAFSVFSQGQNDLHIMKSLLLVVCFMLFMLFIIVLIINRDKILNIRRYRGFSSKSECQSRACINNDFEVSTFSHDCNNSS